VVLAWKVWETRLLLWAHASQGQHDRTSAGQLQQLLNEWSDAEQRLSRQEFVDFRMDWNRRLIQRVSCLTSCSLQSVAMNWGRLVLLNSGGTLMASAMQVKSVQGVGGLHFMPFGRAGRSMALELVKDATL
jgi:hypothetical protein